MRTLEPAGLYVWAALTLGCVAFVVAALVRSVRARAGVAARLGECVSLVAPLAALVVVSIAVHAHVHPTVQLTAPGSMWAWSFWTTAWIWLFLGLPASGMIALGLAAANGVLSRPSFEPSKFARWIGILVLHVLSWLVVAENFPSV